MNETGSTQPGGGKEEDGRSEQINTVAVEGPRLTGSHPSYVKLCKLENSRHQRRHKAFIRGQISVTRSASLRTQGASSWVQTGKTQPSYWLVAPFPSIPFSSPILGATNSNLQPNLSRCRNQNNIFNNIFSCRNKKNDVQHPAFVQMQHTYLSEVEFHHILQ